MGTTNLQIYKNLFSDHRSEGHYGHFDELFDTTEDLFSCHNSWTICRRRATSFPDYAGFSYLLSKGRVTGQIHDGLHKSYTLSSELSGEYVPECDVICPHRGGDGGVKSASKKILLKTELWLRYTTQTLVRDHHQFLQHFSVKIDSDKLLYCLTGNANIGFTEGDAFLWDLSRLKNPRLLPSWLVRNWTILAQSGFISSFKEIWS